MDQQNNETRHVPTEQEIARAEAEAVRALLNGEASAPGAKRDEAFVPYVDDVPEPPKPAEPDPLEDDDDDDEYIPSEMEKRIDAMTPQQWKRWQILGGAAAGLAAIAMLFLGEELATYGLIVAALIALVVPRYLERAWRRKLTTARTAMIIAMLAGLVISFVVNLARGGFSAKG